MLFNQLEFRTLLPRILDARRRRGAPSAPEADDARRRGVDRARREGRGSQSLRAAANGDARRGRSRAGRAPPGRSDLVALGVSPATTAPTSTASCSRRRRCATALEALVAAEQPAARRAPRQGADARARTSTCASLDARHRGDGVPPRSRARGSTSLEDLALRYLSLELTSPDRDEGTLDLDGDAGVEETQRRAAVLLRLVDALEEALRRARARRPLRAHRAAARAACSREMEDAGVRIDVDFLEELGKELGDECRRLEAEIHAQAGEQFNVNSTPQLRRILFEKLGLTPVKKTKTGPSTDADSLQKMAEEHPIVETLLRYREVEKLRSTYADALPPLVARRRSHPRDVQPARHHHRPHLVGVAEPAERAGAHRRAAASCGEAFIADEGCGLLTADYSQIELRVLAHLADDPGLIDAFERGADVHTTTAARGVRRRRGQGRRVPAPLRQGRQLRARVRHGGLRPRAAARHPDRSGPRDPRRVLRRVPEHRRAT